MPHALRELMRGGWSSIARFGLAVAVTFGLEVAHCGCCSSRLQTRGFFPPIRETNPASKEAGYNQNVTSQVDESA